MPELHPSIVALVSLSANIAANHPNQGMCQIDRLRQYGVDKEQIDTVIEIARHIRDEAARKLDEKFDAAYVRPAEVRSVRQHRRGRGRRALLHADGYRPGLLLRSAHMKQIKVLGSGCRNCETTARLIADIAAAKGVHIELEKVTDMAAIIGYGIMSTPGVVIDGQVVHAGGVPDRKKIEGWLG